MFLWHLPEQRVNHTHPSPAEQASASSKANRLLERLGVSPSAFIPFATLIVVIALLVPLHALARRRRRSGRDFSKADGGGNRRGVCPSAFIAIATLVVVVAWLVPINTLLLHMLLYAFHLVASVQLAAHGSSAAFLCVLPGTSTNVVQRHTLRLRLHANLSSAAVQILAMQAIATWHLPPSPPKWLSTRVMLLRTLLATRAPN